MEISWIATPIMGAAIGYTTNWLAIKMLFRPYEEKRVLGFKIPFTPGLIPKERERIADAVGQVVQEYLLTDEVILKELTSEGVQKSIGTALEQYWANNDHKLDFNKLIPVSQQQEVYESATGFLVSEILKLMQDEPFLEQVSEMIWNSLESYLEQYTLDSWMQAHSLDLESMVGYLSENTGLKSVFHQKASEFLDSDKRLVEIVGEGTLVQIKAMLNYNEPKIQQEIRDLMRREVFSTRVQAMISDLVAQKLGALGAMFVNAATLYDGIVEGVEKQLDQMTVSNIAYDYLAGIFDRQLFELLPQAQKEQIIEQVENKLFDKKWLASVVRAGFGSQKLSGLISSDALKTMLKKGLKSWIGRGHEQKEPIHRFIERFIAKRLESPIELNREQQTKWNQRIIDAYLHSVDTYIRPMIKQASLAQIVANQINAFGVKLLEDMILTIAKKELSAITWLGALLGFLMSVILLII